MRTVEQEIIERLHKLDEDAQHRVLDFIEQLNDRVPTNYSPRELMMLPAAERERIVAEAFKLAENEDFEIFEAFGYTP